MIWDKPELYQYDELSELKKYLNPQWFNDRTIQNGNTRLIIQFRNRHSDEKKEVIIRNHNNFDAAKKLLQESKAL